MRILAQLLVATCACSLGPIALAAQAEKSPKPAAECAVRWKGDTFKGAAIASGISDAVAGAAAVWGAWAGAQGYVLDLDPDMRRLFIHREARSASSEAALLARALAAVDKLAPRPRGSAKPARVLAVLELDGPKDLGTLLDDLGQRFNYLATWARGEKGQLGFVLEEPLAAAFLATAPDVKEWNPKNELVNRAAQLALFERFGRIPNWLMQGLAWHVELSVLNSIYCFPFRSGFVAKKEHKSWSEQLKSLVVPPGPEVAPRRLTIDDLTGWKRGTYENDRALIAWGAASFLAKKHPEALPLILDDLRVLREKESKLTKPDGSWQIDPDYEVPADKQLAILKARAGEDFFAELQRFCAGN
ncbi:MAG TPA: hypothetical protein VM509_00655 [Planctomycetota bacterium]|nr:hypothetical protein [Planctomycetota bacterium]